MENEADCHCRQLACNRPVVISSLLISQRQLELSICLLKVNCLHTYEAYVSHDPQSLQHAVHGLSLTHLKKFVFCSDKRVNDRFCHSMSGINNWEEK